MNLPKREKPGAGGEGADSVARYIFQQSEKSADREWDDDEQFRFMDFSGDPLVVAGEEDEPIVAAIVATGPEGEVSVAEYISLDEANADWKELEEEFEDEGEEPVEEER